MSVPSIVFSGLSRDFRRFQESIYAHADSFPESGQFGLQGLVREANDFLQLQIESGIAADRAIAFLRFDPPPPRPAQLTTAAEKDWMFAHTQFQNQCRDIAALKTFILDALDPSSKSHLEADGGTTRRTVPAIMTYLRTTFATVPAAEINELRAALLIPFRAGDSIREFTTRHVDTQTALSLAGDARTPYSQASSLLEALDQCGLFRFASESYRNAHPEPRTHTLADVITMAHATYDNRPAAPTTGSMRYAAAVPSMDLTAAQLEVARAILAAEPSALAATDTRADRRTPLGRRRPSTGHWCWTHGFFGHNSADCRSPREGHNMNATAANRLGGSDRRRK